MRIVDRDGKYTDTWRGMACGFGCGLVLVVLNGMFGFGLNVS